MFRDLIINFDSVRYDKQLGYTFIEGWGMNPVTKDPVTISANVPIIFNYINRIDVSRIYNIKRTASFGFFVILKGDYKKMNLKLTFKSGLVEETITSKQLENYKLYTMPTRMFKLLQKYGFIKGSESPYDYPLEQIPKALPDDEYKPWIENIEETLFLPEKEQKEKFTFIVKVDKEDIDKTIDSILQNGKNEIILISQEPFESNKFKVIVNNDLATAYNEAIEKASGNYIIFTENKDIVSPHLINEVDNYIQDNPETDFIYADSDLITNEGERYDLKFKPDYDEFFLSFHNYILQPTIIKKNLLQKIGGFRKNYMGLKNYDLILRATKEANKVGHIPKILYHWNKDTSNFFHLDRPDFTDAVKIVESNLEEIPYSAKISDRDYIFDHVFENKLPSVTIITGVLEGFSDKKTIETIKHLLFELIYPDFKIIAVNCTPFEKSDKVIFKEDKKAKNLAELYNNAASNVHSDYLIFLKPGFKANEFFWLKEMIEIAEHPSVGIVGPKIFNELHQYEEAGIYLDNFKPYYFAKNTNVRNVGANGEVRIPREMFAISPDCFLINTKLFHELGGFNPDISTSLISIDMSIRAREKNLKTVVAMDTPISFTDTRNQPKLNLEELLEKYPKEYFIDGSVNQNLRPSGTALPYFREK